MKPARTGTAFTLIEVMVVLAMMGILVALASVAPEAPVLEAADVLVRERAQQWLDYEADAIAHGTNPDPVVVEKLKALVPGGERSVAATPDGAVRVEIRWHRPTAREGSMELVVFRGRS